MIDEFCNKIHEPITTLAELEEWLLSAQIEITSLTWSCGLWRCVVEQRGSTSGRTIGTSGASLAHAVTNAVVQYLAWAEEEDRRLDSPNYISEE
jgi:hypothetical protein